jgi:hypothetical protein
MLNNRFLVIILRNSNGGMSLVMIDGLEGVEEDFVFYTIDIETGNYFFMITVLVH